MSRKDRGIHRSITRRDFLDGVRIAVTGSIVSYPWLEAAGSPADYYPPALTGLRGSHPGSFEVAHEMRDGKVFEVGPDGPEGKTGETYDLIVVGGGIITVNRWPHGYAYGYTALTDPEFADGASEERPNVVGRRPFGRIHVANSDAAASAYTHAAIDEAHRAVSEIVGSRESENAI